MCRWLEVSRSGFCEWRNAPESATARWRGILTLIVKKSFDESDGTYGYRRVRADLVARGVPAGPELVRSVMRELGLEPCQPRPWRFSLTEGDGREHDIPDLVKRDFTAGAPGEKMVGGITCIPMWQGPDLRKLLCEMVGHFAELLIFSPKNSFPIWPHSRKFFVIGDLWMKNLDVTHR